MEFTALDPKQGVVFYTLDRERTAKPAFLRRTQECLNCHLIPGTLYVPGLMVTSVIPRPDGSPRFPGAAVVMDSRTPLDQRWGGWYVTGTSGNLQHRGNAVAPNSDQPTVFDFKNTQNLTSLDDRFDTTAYLAPGSDLIALMTLEHQTRVIRSDYKAWVGDPDCEAGRKDGAVSRPHGVPDRRVSLVHAFRGRSRK